MAMMYPVLGLLAAMLLLAAAVTGWWWPRRRPAQALLTAAADELRSLPRYRALARRRARRLAVELLAVTLVAAGTCLLVARPVEATSQNETRSNRDVVLCLDVSGSMTPVVHEILDAFTQVAGDLEGERIGLVFFDASAVTVFPLTDDVTYIRDQLQASRTQLTGAPVPGTQVGDVGTSLIGDGLASCLQRFDDPARSRTVVLATDNQTSGKPLFSLDQAVTKAVDAGILVFGITPADNSAAASNQLTDQVKRTQGDVLLLGPDTRSITDAVRATEARARPNAATLATRDVIWPGAVAMLAGLLVAALATRRRS